MELIFARTVQYTTPDSDSVCNILQSKGIGWMGVASNNSIPDVVLAGLQREDAIKTQATGKTAVAEKQKVNIFRIRNIHRPVPASNYNYLKPPRPDCPCHTPSSPRPIPILHICAASLSAVCPPPVAVPVIALFTRTCALHNVPAHVPPPAHRHTPDLPSAGSREKN